MSINLPNKIVEKFSGVNLTTNAIFGIDQRGTYSSFTSLSTGSFLCDCWIVNGETDVSTCYAKCDNGVIYLKGYANAGERIKITNIDKYDFKHNIAKTTFDDYTLISEDYLKNPFILYKCYITSFLDCIVTKGKLKISSRPRYNSSIYTDIFDDAQYVYTNNDTVLTTAAMCKSTSAVSFDARAGIFIDFLEDGEFDLQIFNFREYVGKYKTPPKYEYQSNVFASLERCRKYYQSGNEVAYHFFYLYVNWHVETYVFFTPDMVSSPSVSTDIDSSQTFNILPFIVNTVYDPPGSEWSTSAQAIDNQKFIFRTSFDFPGGENKQFVQTICTWTAEITS